MNFNHAITKMTRTLNGVKKKKKKRERQTFNANHASQPFK